MKVIYEDEKKTNPNPQFKTINKIIIKSEDRELIKYYGSDTSLLELDDFNEYGWDFLVRKLKYNSRSPLDFLVDERKEEIGKDLDDIKKVSKTFFPTLSSTEEDPSLLGYFGTISVNKQKLLMVNVPKKFSSAEFYEDDNLIFTTEFEEDEIKYSKLVWFVITYGDETVVEDINISYFSWLTNTNPHRNMNDYLLRNDKKAVVDASIEVVEKVDNNIWMDLSSNTIVGNNTIENHPIIDNRLDYASEDSGIWSKRITYKAGDKVSWRDKTWLSLIDNNRGNYPLLSNAWEIENEIPIGTTRCMITTYILIPPPRPGWQPGRRNVNGCRITPNIFTFPKSGVKTVSCLPINGYILSSASQKDNYYAYTEKKAFDLKITKQGQQNTIPLRCAIGTGIGTIKKYTGDNWEIIESISLNMAEENNIKFPLYGHDSITSLVVEYVLEGNIMETVEYDISVLKPGENNDMIFPFTLDRPCSVMFNYTLSDSLYYVHLIEYSGFYVDYTEREVIPEGSTNITFIPINENKRGINILINGDQEKKLILGEEDQQNTVRLNDGPDGVPGTSLRISYIPENKRYILDISEINQNLTLEVYGN